MPSSASELVGRELELSQLEEALAEGSRGKTHAVLVGGEPGIGKSLLVAHAAELASRGGSTVAWGRCWEAGGAPGYWPWVQALRTLVANLPTDVREFAPDSPLFDVLPEIGRPEPLAARPSADPEAARFRLFDDLVRLLAGFAARRPVILVLEDLHAADAPSLLLLTFVVRSLGEANAVVLGTYRDVELDADHPLSATLGELRREPSVRWLDLTGLPPEHVARLAGALAGTRIPIAVAGLIHAETDGNPLFVGEVVRLLAPKGVLTSLEGASGLRAVLPGGVRSVIGRRFESIPPVDREILGAASVLGRDFDIHLVAEISERPLDDVLVAIDAARAASIVEPIGPDARERFAHSVIREVLYEDVPDGRRRDLHRRAAEALESIAGAEEARLDEIANHHFRSLPGGDARRAVEAADRAAGRALRLLAYEEAARLYGIALRALEHAGGDRGRRCELLLALGDSLARAGDLDGARDAFRRAADIAVEEGLPALQARAALGYGGRFVWEAGRGDPHLRRLLHEALANLPEANVELRARVLARLAAGPMRDDLDRSVRDRMSREAVDAARRLGDARTLAYCLDGRYSAVWWADNLDERISIADELMRAARDAGEPERALQGHHYRCVARLELADLAGFEADLRAQERLADELRQPVHRWYAVMVRTMAATLQGRLDDVDRLLDECYDLGLRAHGRIMEGYRALQLHALDRERGRGAVSLDRLAEAVRAFETYVVLRCAHAQTFADTGLLDDARSIVEELAPDRFAAVPRNEEWLYALCLLGDVAADTKDEGRAATLLELLDPFERRVAVSPVNACSGAVARVTGRLAWTIGDRERASASFATALEVNDAISARPWMARTTLDHADVLLDEGTPQAVERAAALARSVLDLPPTPALVERATMTLSRAGGSPTVSRAFLFTDIVASTVLLEAIGDEAWQHLRSWHDRTLRLAFDEHGGEEVDHAGDGFFVAFASARDALACAITVQRALEEHRQSTGFAPRVRIGVHAADATLDPHGYAGLGVHTAARIGALAGPGEILASAATVASVPGATGVDPREVDLKGVSEPITVVRVPWSS